MFDEDDQILEENPAYDDEAKNEQGATAETGSINGNSSSPNSGTGSNEGGQMFTPTVEFAESSDLDRDGLSDLDERSYRTDPFAPDTDLDGYTDGAEVAWGLNPLDPSDGIVPLEKRFGLVVVSDVTSDRDLDGLSDVFEEWFGTDPDLPDTDNDGYPDGIELLNGTNPLVPDDPGIDTDGDGLSDAMERRFGTSPREVDSDRDRISDPDELLLSLDPLDPDEDRNGIIDGVTFPQRTFRFSPPDPVTRQFYWSE